MIVTFFVNLGQTLSGIVLKIPLTFGKILLNIIEILQHWLRLEIHKITDKGSKDQKVLDSKPKVLSSCSKSNKLTSNTLLKNNEHIFFDEETLGNDIKELFERVELASLIRNEYESTKEDKVETEISNISTLSEDDFKYFSEIDNYYNYPPENFTDTCYSTECVESSQKQSELIEIKSTDSEETCQNFGITSDESEETEVLENFRQNEVESNTSSILKRSKSSARKNLWKKIVKKTRSGIFHGKKKFYRMTQPKRPDNDSELHKLLENKGNLSIIENSGDAFGYPRTIGIIKFQEKLDPLENNLSLNIFESPWVLSSEKENFLNILDGLPPNNSPRLEESMNLSSVQMDQRTKQVSREELIRISAEIQTRTCLSRCRGRVMEMADTGSSDHSRSSPDHDQTLLVDIGAEPEPYLPGKKELVDSIGDKITPLTKQEICDNGLAPKMHLLDDSVIIKDFNSSQDTIPSEGSTAIENNASSIEDLIDFGSDGDMFLSCCREPKEADFDQNFAENTGKKGLLKRRSKRSPKSSDVPPKKNVHFSDDAEVFLFQVSSSIVDDSDPDQPSIAPMKVPLDLIKVTIPARIPVRRHSPKMPRKSLKRKPRQLSGSESPTDHLRKRHQEISNEKTPLLRQSPPQIPFNNDSSESESVERYSPTSEFEKTVSLQPGDLKPETSSTSLSVKSVKSNGNFFRKLYSRFIHQSV